MKRAAGFIFMLIFAVFIAVTPVNASPAVGDTAGYVLYSDIRAFINGEPIPCYNIGGQTAVVLEDLRSYGFDVVWDETERALFVSFVNSGVSSIPIYEHGRATGEIAFPYLHTDINAFANGILIPSFAIDGRLCVAIEDLKIFGEVNWDSTARTISLTTTQTPVQNRQHISIIGDANFTLFTQTALDLIKQDPESYALVLQYIGIIEQGEQSGMWAFRDPPAFVVGTATYTSSTTWYAGCIVHDAVHSWQYYRTLTELGYVPDEAWTGMDAEMEALEIQLIFLLNINAPIYEISHLESLRGVNWWEIERSW